MAFEKPTNEQLENRFSPVIKASAKEHVERIGLLQQVTTQAAKDLVELTPVSAEQSRALNALDEFYMLGQLAIVRNEKR